MNKKKRKISEVITDAKEKIRDQLEQTAKATTSVKGQVEEQGKKMTEKLTETAKDTKALVQENSESIATFLSVMLIL